MKTITNTLLGVMLLGAVASANAAVVQVWTCTLKDGKTSADVTQASTAWLAAAKGLKGGADIKAYHEFPLAATAGSGGFNFVMILPDAETWGAFTGGYADSPAAKADDDWNAVASCSGSSLWESVEVK
jgi:hypothetical protein